MISVLTICSANYLAHAKSLGDSVREHNPDFHFVIGLVDRQPKELETTYLHEFEVIPVEELKLHEFVDMAKRYNVVELNTALKPFYMSFLFERNPDVEAVIYLDPDVVVYASLNALVSRLKNSSILLTPHSCTYDDSSKSLHSERTMLWVGVYNLGFIAASRTADTVAFLNWWKVRLQNYCFYRPGVGALFFDQLWIVLAPLYFKGVYVETDPGYNMSYWNLFERRLTVRSGRYFVNHNYPLIFFHFSGYKAESPDEIVGVRREDPVTSFAERQDLRPIYDDYRNRLLDRNYISIKSLPWYFASEPAPSRLIYFKSFLKGVLKHLVGCLPSNAKRLLIRLATFVVQNTVSIEYR